MIKVVLIDLKALFDYDPHERVQAFIRLCPSSSFEEFGAISRVLCEDAKVLQQDFEYGKITAADFKRSLEKLLNASVLPSADFWSAHCVGFTPDRAAIRSCIQVKEAHPLIKFVAMGQVDRKVFGHLLELCGDLEFDDSAVSFMEGGKLEPENFKSLLAALSVEAIECLTIDTLSKARHLSSDVSAQT